MLAQPDERHSDAVDRPKYPDPRGGDWVIFLRKFHHERERRGRAVATRCRHDAEAGKRDEWRRIWRRLHDQPRARARKPDQIIRNQGPATFDQREGKFAFTSAARSGDQHSAARQG